ncbi:hypothetical protein ACYATL_06030 [Actinotignum timonense]|uniref:hypothetical protein n=1 Tax=Actinotignum TaxID=1653174 RepID=UPI002551BBFF|nr:hypothetical protein [Actinotignum timonense]MDK6907374.1 hypothetical protein [Actinotignum timonense]
MKSGFADTFVDTVFEVTPPAVNWSGITESFAARRTNTFTADFTDCPAVPDSSQRSVFLFWYVKSFLIALPAFLQKESEPGANSTPAGKSASSV